jgi:hypothetical protein
MGLLACKNRKMRARVLTRYALPLHPFCVIPLCASRSARLDSHNTARNRDPPSLRCVCVGSRTINPKPQRAARMAVPSGLCSTDIEIRDIALLLDRWQAMDKLFSAQLSAQSVQELPEEA